MKFSQADWIGPVLLMLLLSVVLNIIQDQKIDSLYSQIEFMLDSERALIHELPLEDSKSVEETDTIYPSVL